MTAVGVNALGAQVAEVHQRERRLRRLAVEGAGLVDCIDFTKALFQMGIGFLKAGFCLCLRLDLGPGTVRNSPPFFPSRCPPGFV